MRLPTVTTARFSVTLIRHRTPVEWLKRATQIEGFCGVGDDKTLPRGFLNQKYFLQDGEEGFRHYIKERIVQMSKWIDANNDSKDVKCPAPKKLSEKAAKDCLD